MSTSFIIEDVDSDQPDLDKLPPKKMMNNIEKCNDGDKLQTNFEGKSEEIYEVQKVLEHMCLPEGIYLKVRWAGYGEDEDSWEPEADLLEGAGELVSDYFNMLSDKEKKSINKCKRNMSKNNTKNEKKSKKTIEKKPLVSDDELREDSSPPKKKNTRQDRSLVLTKAAVKSYGTSVQSSAKKSAIMHRQIWLQEDSGSSDDEKRCDGISFDDEIKAKVLFKNKTAQKDKNHGKDAVLLNKKTSTLGTDSVAEYSKMSNNTVDADPMESIVTTTKNHSTNDDSTGWCVEGLAQHNEHGSEKLMVLINNKMSNERRVTSTRDAYDLVGWGFCEWLLDRCEF